MGIRVTDISRRDFLICGLVMPAMIGLTGVAAASQSPVPGRPSRAFSTAAHGAIGDGTSDDAPAIQNAIDLLSSQGGGQLTLPAGTFAIGRILQLHEGVVLDLQNSIIRPTAGADLPRLISVAGNGAAILNGMFEGRDITPPSGPYRTGGYSGIAIFVAGPLANVRIANCTFRNFPAGPILALSREPGANNLVVEGCRFVNNQSFTAAETNALCHFHGFENSRQVDCEAVGYNWKGFYCANSRENRILRCRTSGGTAGHASHYLSGGSDNAIEACVHEGPGMGFKCHASLRPRIVEFRAASCAAGGSFQGCRSFVCERVTVVDPNTAGLSIMGLSGVAATGGNVSQFRTTRSMPGTAANHRGIHVVAAPGGAIDGLTIAQSRIENFLFGIHIENSGHRQTNISITGNEMINAGQYGILAFLGGGRIASNTIRMDGRAVEAAIFVAGDRNSRSGAVEVRENQISGTTGDAIQIGEGWPVDFDSVTILENRSSGGAIFLDIRADRRRGDRVRRLLVSSNTATDLSDRAYNLSLNASAPTSARMEGNRFVDAAGNAMRESISNAVGVVFERLD